MATLLDNLLYCLCLLTSLACVALLLRAWSRTGVRLLLWSGLSFICMSLGNLVLIIDVQLPDVDLHVYRLGLSLAAGLILVSGFAWEAR